MIYQAIDSVLLAVPDPDLASAPHRRLGLPVSPGTLGPWSVRVGAGRSPFALEFLTPAVDEPLSALAREALQAGRPCFAVALRVADLDHALQQLATHGMHAHPQAFHRAGQSAGRLAWLPLLNEAGTHLVLLQHTQAVPEPEPAPSGLILKRLDHLAAVTPDLEVKTRFWTDVLGIPATGEVRTPTLIIRQFRIGDAICELLGPASPDSPLWQRQPGLIPMVSWEVPDVDAAVQLSRQAGFNVPDATPGALPGTRITTVPGTELAGVNLQLLQYVR
jgi:catechol 2,3-dioxygenase-like lactoylglutathione lyase family enzyme